MFLLKLFIGVFILYIYPELTETVLELKTCFKASHFVAWLHTNRVQITVGALVFHGSQNQNKMSVQHKSGMSL